MLDTKNNIEINSMELQLIGYSWPEPTRHTIELVVFTINKEDGYGERIVEVRKIIFEMVVKCKGTVTMTTYEVCGAISRAA